MRKPCEGHSCASCGTQWKCLEVTCDVAQSVKVNQQGPFCNLCYHARMLAYVVRYRRLPRSVGMLALVRAYQDVFKEEA